MDASALKSVTTQLMQQQESHWITAGALALFVYDWLLCIDDEVKYIWRSRVTFGKTLFFIQRYLTLAIGIVDVTYVSSSNDSPSFCKQSQLINAYGTAVVTIIVQLTIVIRVYALYGRSKVVLAFLLAFFVTCNTTTLVLYGILVKRIGFGTNPLHGIVSVCRLTCNGCNGYFTNVYTPILAFDTVIAFMIVWKAYVSHTERAMAPTLARLYRDGMVYFAVIFAVVLTNTLFFSVAKGAIQAWFIPFMRVLMSMMATRILLSLHRQVNRSVGGTTTNEDGFVFSATKGRFVPLEVSVPSTTSEETRTGTTEYTLADLSGHLNTPASSKPRDGASPDLEGAKARADARRLSVITSRSGSIWDDRQATRSVPVEVTRQGRKPSIRLSGSRFVEDV